MNCCFYCGAGGVVLVVCLFLSLQRRSLLVVAVDKNLTSRDSLERRRERRERPASWLLDHSPRPRSVVFPDPEYSRKCTLEITNMLSEIDSASPPVALSLRHGAIF